MEDRLTDPPGRGARPGFALIALTAILGITAAWWALALWPAAAEPEWLARTRAACFGSERGGLPDAGGWIVLIGEPIGMLVALALIGGRSLRRDFAWLTATRVRRLATASAAALMLLATGLLGTRVARAWEGGRIASAPDAAALRRVRRDLPRIPLVDQSGRRISLDGMRGPALVTFAFGHCRTVCPVIVNDLQAARRRANRRDIPVVVVTLDPWRDTPERLHTIAAHWQLAEHDLVLSGSVDAVEATLDSLGIARRRNDTTGDVDHVTTVFVLDRTGRIGWRGDGGVGGVGELLERL